ncbi:hypothetical protein E4J66_08290 [Actinomyces viscosus]|nr:hypothetical protein E4J66_08290 [Actinomyces viscosus]
MTTPSAVIICERQPGAHQPGQLGRAAVPAWSSRPSGSGTAFSVQNVLLSLTTEGRPQSSARQRSARG